MSADTPNKRASSQGLCLPFRAAAPFPDGSLGQAGDLSFAAYSYDLAPAIEDGGSLVPSVRKSRKFFHHQLPTFGPSAQIEYVLRTRVAKPLDLPPWLPPSLLEGRVFRTPPQPGEYLDRPRPRRKSSGGAPRGHADWLRGHAWRHAGAPASTADDLPVIRRARVAYPPDFAGDAMRGVVEWFRGRGRGRGRRPKPPKPQDDVRFADARLARGDFPEEILRGRAWRGRVPIQNLAGFPRVPSRKARPDYTKTPRLNGRVLRWGPPAPTEPFLLRWTRAARGGPPPPAPGRSTRHRLPLTGVDAQVGIWWSRFVRQQPPPRDLLDGDVWRHDIYHTGESPPVPECSPDYQRPEIDDECPTRPEPAEHDCPTRFEKELTPPARPSRCENER